MRCHWLRLRAIVHPTEDPDKVRRALLGAACLDVDAADRIEETELEMHHGGTNRIQELELTRQREIRAVLQAVTEDAAALQELLAALDARTDDDGVLFFRLDKMGAFAGEHRLIQRGESIQARCKPEVHPGSREGALRALENWLQGRRQGS